MHHNRRFRREWEVSSVSNTISRPVVRTLFALYLVAALSLGPVAAAQASPGSTTGTHAEISSHPDVIVSPDDGDLLNESDDSTNTTETVDNTTDTVDRTVDNTTDTVDNTAGGSLDGTTETIDETVENTTEAVDENVENTSDTVDETTNSVESTTDGTVETVENTTDEPITSTAGLLGATLDGALESVDAGLPTIVDSGSESDDTRSVRSEQASGDAVAGEQDASGAGDTSDESGPTVPVPAPVPAAAAGVGVIVVGAVGASALSASGGSAATSPGVTRSVTLGAQSTATGVRNLLASFGDKLWKVGAVLRYSRWDDSDPLEHDVRREIYDTVEDAPGIYLSKIDEQTDRSLSSLRHHLRILEEENLLTTEKVRGKRRYFPVTRGADDPALVAALDDPATETILTTLAEEGPSSGGDLSEALDRDPSTVSHHLSRLEEEGLVERERDGRAVVNKLSDSAAMALSDAPAASADGAVPADD